MLLLSYSDHYKKLAANYDRYHLVQNQARAKFTQRHISLSPFDQLVDIGGGTGQTSLIMKTNIGMKKSVVCVDPCKEMLDVAAQKDGIVAIHSTAEDFLSSKPKYPLKHVVMHGCSHHFEDPELVFSSLAKHMPDDGVCFITCYPAKNTLPFFKALKHLEASNGTTDSKLHIFCQMIKSLGLEYKVVKGVEVGEMDKQLWYESIRNKASSSLEKFSDDELEEGIKELEEQYKDAKTIKLDISFIGIVITK